MMHRKRGASLLGLLVIAALGMTALAAGAQAAAPGFLINKVPVGALKATGSATQEGTGSLLVQGLNFKLSCTSVTVDEGLVESNTVARMVVLNTGCTVLSLSKPSEEIHCHVQEPIKVEAVFLPAELTNGEPAVLAEKIKGLVVLHLPGAGGLTSTPCVLPLDNTVTGESCAAIANNDTVNLLVFSSPSVECKAKTALEGGTEGSGAVKDALKYGAQTAISHGASTLFLVGAHEGLTIGVSLY